MAVQYLLTAILKLWKKALWDVKNTCRSVICWGNRKCNSNKTKHIETSFFKVRNFTASATPAVKLLPCPSQREANRKPQHRIYITCVFRCSLLSLKPRGLAQAAVSREDLSKATSDRSFKKNKTTLSVFKEFRPQLLILLKPPCVSPATGSSECWLFSVPLAWNFLSCTPEYFCLVALVRETTQVHRCVSDESVMTLLV